LVGGDGEGEGVAVGVVVCVGGFVLLVVEGAWLAYEVAHYFLNDGAYRCEVLVFVQLFLL